MGVVTVAPPPELPPLVEPPIRRPAASPGGAVVQLILLALWLEAVMQKNDEASTDFTLKDLFGDDPIGTYRGKKAAARACAECCGIIAEEGEKTLRKIAPNLDKVSPKTKDQVKRYRRIKDTRQPGW